MLQLKQLSGNSVMLDSFVNILRNSAVSFFEALEVARCSIIIHQNDYYINN